MYISLVILAQGNTNEMNPYLVLFVFLYCSKNSLYNSIVGLCLSGVAWKRSKGLYNDLPRYSSHEILVFIHNCLLKYSCEDHSW